MASPLINAAGVSKSYGARTLFEGVDLVIEAGDCVGVIGPNGAGKTTLLEILAGEAAPDDGTVTRRRGLRVGYVPQEERLDAGATVLATALAAAVEAADPSVVETEVEREVRARIAVERAGFGDPDQRVGELSGGWRKRAAVAAALARDPEVLLLDEPTNHLDLQGIVWLEQLLASGGPAYVVISHDRAFLERTARRMLEVAPEYPGGVLAVEGSYGEFVEQRKVYLKARERYRDSLANQARREQEWLDRGPKARTSKSQDRIDRAGRIKEELGDLDRGRRPGPIGLELDGSGRRTKRLLVAEGLGASVAGRRLFGGLDFVLSPGRRVGVVGPNGSGKTTLLRILAGEREPEAGTVRTADGLEAVYFDQTREHLDLDRPLRWALAGAADRKERCQKGARHAITP